MTVHFDWLVAIVTAVSAAALYQKAVAAAEAALQ